MGYGLIDVGRDARQQASLGLRDVAERETQREYVSQQFRRQRQQGKMNLLGLGAGAGMAVGATYGAAGGPVGLGIGAAVGLLASRLF